MAPLNIYVASFMYEPVYIAKIPGAFAYLIANFS